eukprot:CAMPEP_0119120104 /NCGR_PEP_ID=MMETSP1310-20130426/1297_1 /TAXON_ID=464262 /ORGANISM="Genus nov. species nov., Strain RCC2339" /LENGTH=493 /DNA_ID=CAMNT_0007109569 /DNA_START=56 /DNA_END=1537 /DNA_ORIENTATION=+
MTENRKWHPCVVLFLIVLTVQVTTAMYFPSRGKHDDAKKGAASEEATRRYTDNAAFYACGDMPGRDTRKKVFDTWFSPGYLHIASIGGVGTSSLVEQVHKEESKCFSVSGDKVINQDYIKHTLYPYVYGPKLQIYATGDAIRGVLSLARRGYLTWQAFKVSGYTCVLNATDSKLNSVERKRALYNYAKTKADVFRFSEHVCDYLTADVGYPRIVLNSQEGSKELSNALCESGLDTMDVDLLAQSVASVSLGSKRVRFNTNFFLSQTEQAQLYEMLKEKYATLQCVLGTLPPVFILPPTRSDGHLRTDEYEQLVAASDVCTAMLALESHMNPITIGGGFGNKQIRRLGGSKQKLHVGPDNYVTESAEKVFRDKLARVVETHAVVGLGRPTHFPIPREGHLVFDPVAHLTKASFRSKEESAQALREAVEKLWRNTRLSFNSSTNYCTENCQKSCRHIGVHLPDDFSRTKGESILEKLRTDLTERAASHDRSKSRL